MSMAGDVQDTQGRWQIIVMMVNDARADAAEPALIAAVNAAFNGAMASQP